MIQRHFTEEGLKNLKKELEGLKTTKRQEIAEHLREAAAHGDLSENFAYQETREEQARLENRIGELEDILRQAVVSADQTRGDTIRIGSRVKVKSEGGEMEFTIVGAQESSLLERKVSVESPIGKSLLNRKRGDIVDIHTIEGVRRYEILEIQ